MARSFWRGGLWMGALQTGAVVAGVVGFGLGWAGAAGQLGTGPRADQVGTGPRAGEPGTGPRAGLEQPGPYTPASMAGERWLVDGFNVLHAGVLRGNDRRGWWREEARARLLERVARFEERAAELWVVFDGPGPGADRERDSERPRVAFAPSADEWLLDAVRRAPDPAAVVIVTADRQLADRARHRGARVVSPRAFLARCGASEVAEAARGAAARRGGEPG